MKKYYFFYGGMFLLAVFSLIFLVRGLIGVKNSSSGSLALSVAFSIISLICLLVVAWIGIVTNRQSARIATVSQKFPKSLIISAMGGNVTVPYARVRNKSHPRIKSVPSWCYVVVVNDQGIVFLSGNPRDPRENFTIPWSMISEVRSGTAAVSRPVPGIVLDLSADTRIDSASFALCRPGSLAAFAILDQRVVDRLVLEIQSIRKDIAA